MNKRLAINFHETFSLSRDSLRQIIEIVHRNEELNKTLLSNTSLGTNYQKAMPKYAFRAGLLDEHNRLTSFGRFAAQHDPGLTQPATQWLLHYHLAAPHRPTAFWNYLVTRRFVPGNTFTADDLVADIAHFLRENAGTVPAARSIRGTATIFVGTYLKPDGLGNLGLLQGSTTDTYLVPTPSAPPRWAVGYALAEYWNAHYQGRLTTNLDDFIGKDFAGIFLMSEERLTDILLQLKHEGMIDVYRISRPYQVVLLQPDCEYALQKMYQT